MNESFGHATMKDVAEVCGVSVTTVSLALRNHPRISAKTKEHVRNEAERIGYKKNPLVAALMANVGRSNLSGSSVTLAAVYDSSRTHVEGNEYHGKLWNGILDRASELGFCVERFYLRDAKIGGSRRLGEILYARGIRGILIPPLTRGGGHLSLDWGMFSSVAIGYSMLKPDLHRVCPDQYQGIRLALHQLSHYGYSRPGLVIAGHSGLRTLHLWGSGFYGFEYAGKMRGVIPVFECGNVNLSQLLEWYEKYSPDVIISGGADLAVWETLKDTSLKIPDDVGFVSLSRRGTAPDVAGINENEYRVGCGAVDQLVHQLYYNEQGVPDHPHTLQISPSWEDGKTCVKFLDAKK